MSKFSLRKRIGSFAHAFRGASTLVRTQHNAWIHFVATVAAVVGGIACRIQATEWALVVFAIALVWMAEALNTAVEFLADEITEERRERLGKAKDVAAFGVLAGAIGAAVIGAIVFLPYLAHK